MKITANRKAKIKASKELTYRVVVNFGGYIGADEEYIVTAADEESARIEAEDLAKNDLNIQDIAESDYGEWVVTVGFCDFIGAEEDYEVTADDEDEASEEALEMASADLSGEVVGITDEDEE